MITVASLSPVTAATDLDLAVQAFGIERAAMAEILADCAPGKRVDLCHRCGDILTVPIDAGTELLCKGTYCSHVDDDAPEWCGECDGGVKNGRFCSCPLGQSYPEAAEDGEEIDDDPQCVCGVYRSEHALCGCPEGFQTRAAWNAERDRIRERVFAGAYDDYDPEGGW